MELKEFNQGVGEMLMYLQCIEHDIRYIYSYMADGGFESNLSMIDEEKWTLGELIHSLEEIDGEYGSSLFSPDEYKLLYSVVRIRNHYAHKVYLSFCYEDDEESFKEAYESECIRLEKEKEEISSLYEAVERIRLSYMREDN